MVTAHSAAGETKRLASLHGLALDHAAEERFDRITRIAAALFDVPIALINIVDSDTVWHKSRYGFASLSSCRSETFCSHTIADSQPLVIEDTLGSNLLDIKLTHNSLPIRFYAGYPLTTPTGEAVGALCLLDTRPRKLDSAKLQTLRDLARMVENEFAQIFAQHRADRELVQQLKQTLLLNQILATVTSSLDQQFVLDTMCNELATALGIPNAGVAVVDPTGEYLEVIAHARIGNWPSTRGIRLPLAGNEASLYVLNQRQPLAVADVLQDDRLASSQDILLALGIRAILIVPIIVSDEVLGTLGLDWAEPHTFTTTEIDLVQQVALMVGQALERARLYSTVQQELHERQRIEQALRQSEARSHALLDAVPDQMIRLNRAGVLLDHTPPHHSALLPNQLAGCHVTDYYPPEVAQQAERALNDLFLTEQVQVLEYQLRQNDAATDYEARFARCGEDEALVIVRNITERKHVDRLKNEFVSVVSHELRTPLTSIRGSLGLLIGGVAGDLSPQAQQMIEIAHHNSERLVRLINDILDVEKIESGKLVFVFKPQPIAQILQQTMSANRAYADQFGVAFALESADSPMFVNIDADRMTQVLTNILSNAAKFAPNGSVVTIGYKRHAGGVRISVADCGPGITPAFQSRIFQKFAQADASDTRQKGGTGLGLSIAKAIVEQHQGQISFETELGVGTTFFIDLPEYIFNEEQFPVADSSATSLQPRRVLIVEDNPDVALLLSMMLEDAGFTTDRALTARQATALLAGNHYAAMTVDLVMPDQDGVSFIRSVHAEPKTAHLPILVISARAMSEHAVDKAGLPLVNWLAKPIDRQQLVESMRVLTGTRRIGHARILHVEDDHDIRLLVQQMLQNIAMVTPVASLADARQQLASDQFDLIILDMKLPDGSGMDLLHLLQRSAGQIPIVIFSAYDLSDEATRHAAVALVKSQTSNATFLETITALIASD